MTAQNNTSKYIERERDRLEGVKSEQETFPSTPLQAALWDLWRSYKEDSRAYSLLDMPERVQKKYKEIAEKIKEIDPDARVYALGSTVNGGYVDKESTQDEIEAYKMLKGEKFSDIDIWIKTEIDLNKFGNIEADVLPALIGRSIEIN